MSWKIKRLADICDIKLGKTPSRSDKSYWDDNKLGSNIWVSIADLSRLNTRFISDSKEYITDKGASLFNPVKAGTLLMSFKLSIGKLAYANCDLYTNEAIVALPIKNNKEINSDFLYYYLQHYDWEKETENDIKLKGKTLNKSKLSEIKIPVPSMELQTKIVEKLDSIFLELDKAILATDANRKNSDALFQSYINKIFEKNYDNSKRLKDCCLIKPPKSDLRNLDDLLEVSFMPMEALGVNSKIAIPNQSRKLSEVSGSYTYFAEGDVLLAKITPCFENGKLGIANQLKNKIGFGSSEYIVFRPMNDVDSNWLYYFLNRNEFRFNGAKHMSGAVGHKRVTKEFIEDTILPLPSLVKQKELVSHIENIFAFTKSLELSCQSKSYQLKLLKQSILKKAFNRELVI